MTEREGKERSMVGQKKKLILLHSQGKTTNHVEIFKIE